MMLLLLAACDGPTVKLSDDTGTSSADTDTDTDSDTDTDTDTDTDSDTDTDPIPDVSAYMDPDASTCERYYGDLHPGAKGYWWGSFTGNQAEGWSGSVHWQLYANESWLAEGGADCEVVWSATGPSANVNVCSDCDVGYDMTAFVDRAATTCPESVYFSYQNLAYTYEIRLREGGYSDWYYAGYTMGSGYWVGDEVTDLNYLSAAACVWL